MLDRADVLQLRRDDLECTHIGLKSGFVRKILKKLIHFVLAVQGEAPPLADAPELAVTGGSAVVKSSKLRHKFIDSIFGGALRNKTQTVKKALDKIFGGASGQAPKYLHKATDYVLGGKMADVSHHLKKIVDKTHGYLRKIFRKKSGTENVAM